MAKDTARMTAKSNYKSILDAILDRFGRGEYPFDSLLPTESEMAAAYNVSRPTITKVYNRLQDENYVIKKKGVGTRVVYKKT